MAFLFASSGSLYRSADFGCAQTNMDILGPFFVLFWEEKTGGNFEASDEDDEYVETDSLDQRSSLRERTTSLNSSSKLSNIAVADAARCVGSSNEMSVSEADSTSCL